jgi:hypothetical protein
VLRAASSAADTLTRAGAGHEGQAHDEGREAAVAGLGHTAGVHHRDEREGHDHLPAKQLAHGELGGDHGPVKAAGPAVAHAHGHAGQQAGRQQRAKDAARNLCERASGSLCVCVSLGWGARAVLTQASKQCTHCTSLCAPHTTPPHLQEDVQHRVEHRVCQTDKVCVHRLQRTMHGVCQPAGAQRRHRHSHDSHRTWRRHTSRTATARGGATPRRVSGATHRSRKSAWRW